MNVILRFLKYVNSMPFPFSMKHYQVFGDAASRMKDHALASPESWDALRQEHPFFSIPSSREEWVRVSEITVTKDGQDKDLLPRARELAALIQEKGFDHVFSVGVGGAALEYQLKKLMPQLSVVCSDYSKTTVETLRKVFSESDDIVEFDILAGDWNEMREEYLGERGLCVMYRIDASVSDEEWRRMMQNLAEAKVENVLVIPTGMLTMLSVYNRKSREARWLLKRVPILWSGYVRTKQRFQEFWRPWYAEEACTLGGLKSFLLIRRKKK